MNRKLRTIIFIAIAAAITTTIIIASIWYGAARKPAKEATPEAKETIKIGAVYDLTGPLSGLGEQFKNGILFVVDEVNSQGGINGKEVILVIEDGQSDIESSVSAFNKLVDVDGVKFVRSFESAVSLALKPIAEEKKVLLFADASHPKITENANFVLRHSNIATFDAQVLIEELKRKNPKRVGVIHANDDWWGVTYNQELNRLLLELEPNITVISESHSAKDTDFRTQITEVTAINPEAVIIASPGPAAGSIIKQLKEWGYQGDIFVNVGFFSIPDVQEMAGEAAKAVYYQALDGSPECGEAYFRKYGKELGLFGVYTYTDVEILKYALEQVGEDPEKVANFVKNLREFNGTYERVEITEQGDIVISTKVKIWE